MAEEFATNDRSVAEPKVAGIRVVSVTLSVMEGVPERSMGTIIPGAGKLRSYPCSYVHALVGASLLADR